MAASETETGMTIKLLLSLSFAANRAANVRNTRDRHRPCLANREQRSAARRLSMNSFRSSTQSQAS
jgi:hypothetical protein